MKEKLVEVQLLEVKCEKCQHVWKPRTKVVTCCPKCKSYKWNAKGFKK